MTTAELDAIHDLPYPRLPHPPVRQREIPAYHMIRHSITIHRGCFGGCAFCTISAHQGKTITSRSADSILREIARVAAMPDFTGTITDLGGPSANMYAMTGRRPDTCQQCHRPSCLFPAICPNLDADHAPLLRLYARASSVPGVKRCHVSSGIRHDLALHDTDNGNAYLQTVIRHHLPGRLKVAPEHTADTVLRLMRKPSFALFTRLADLFNRLNRDDGARRQIIPYFISSHPGSATADMAELAATTRDLDFRLEQVQDFTPTPMTLATEMYYTGLHPYTMQPVPSAKTAEEKKEQNIFFFWYKKESRREIEKILVRVKRPDLLARLYPSPRDNRRRQRPESRANH
jgi:uncharacterized radical SAM protein YgiQ